MDQVTHALISELQQRKDYLQDEPVETIYFGGGTPSILKASDIEDIINAVFKFYKVAADAEITLEANPDDLSPGKLNDLKKAGINRLSIGIQSFREEDLKYLSRTHSAQQVTRCIEDAIGSRLSKPEH
jgi:oxygen-independent coproporphyrinogen III oxidase